MVSKKNISALYRAFHDRLKEDGKEQKIIKCKICRLQVPSHSKDAEVCEMCFDVDFWKHQEEIAKKREDIMWAIKTVNGGIIGNCYFKTGSYWQGEKKDGVERLGGATLFATKSDAENVLDLLRLTNNGPNLKTIQVRVSEV